MKRFPTLSECEAALVFCIVLVLFLSFVSCLFGCNTMRQTIIVAPNATFTMPNGPISQPWRNWGTDEPWQISTNQLNSVGTPLHIVVSQDQFK